MDDLQITDSNVDSVVSDITSGGGTGGDIPMSAPAPQAPQEYALQVGGKEIKAPVDKILKWAQMGYDAPNKIGELTKQSQQYQEQLKQTEELKSRYGQVDEYAKGNPDWWNHVEQSYQRAMEAAQQQPAVQDPVMNEVNQLKTQLEELKNFKSQIDAERTQAQRSMEDRALSSEIESIKKIYKDLDFDTPDDSGRTLEMKVLEHAHERGIPNFQTAFRDLYHETLMQRAEDRGRQSVAKGIQKNTKLGLLGKSPTPKGTVSEASDTKKSYGALAREALNEMNN